MPRPRRIALLLIMSMGVLVITQCYGGGAYGPLGAACPQLSGGDPLSARYSANARANAKVATFVAATSDLVAVSLEMESLATEACRTMGRDLGVP
jgi:hypothetical protein